MNLLLNVSLTLLLAVLFMGLKRQLGNWLAPGAFFALFWTILVAAALAMAPDVEVWPPALMFIVACVLAFGAGALCGNASTAREKPCAHAKPIDATSAGRLVIFGGACGMLAAIVLVRESGHGFTPSDVPAIARAYSIARYSQEFTEPLLFRLLIIPHYFAAILGGCLYVFAGTRKQRWITLLPFVPAVMVTLLLTTKASLAMTVLLWIAGFISSLTYSGRLGIPAPDLKFLKKAVFAAAVVAPVVMVGSQMSRYLLTTFEDALDTIVSLRLDFFGYLGPFSAYYRACWVENYAPAFGMFTLPGPFDALGMHQRVIGVFAESVLIGNGHPSNIYTVFRGLIDDFTMPGTLLLLIIAGFAANRSYEMVKKGYITHVSVIAAFYAVTLWSHIVFFFGYNSLIAAWICVTAYLVHTERSREEARGRRIARAGA
jgi:oligosaccharide repeat unit polymerase